MHSQKLQNHTQLLSKRRCYCLKLDIKATKLQQFADKSTDDLSTHTSSPNYLGEQNYQQFLSKYTQTSKLGEGMHSVVYSVEENSTGYTFAAKVTKSDDEMQQRLVEQEVNILRQLNHEGIIKAQKLFNDKMKGVFAMVSEMTNFPQLHNYCGKVDLQWIKQTIKNILLTLKYLHTKNFVHRDISGSNVLADETGNIKLIDFGLAQEINKEGISVSGVKCIAPPELVGDERIDIWNVGMLILELTQGKIIKSKRVEKLVLNPEWRKKWGCELVELVERILCAQENRVTAKEALEMSIFQ